MFVSVLKFCPNHVLLLSAFAFHPMLNLSGFLEPSSADGMNFPTQQLHQTSSAEGDGIGGGGRDRRMGVRWCCIKFLAITNPRGWCLSRAQQVRWTWSQVLECHV